MRLRIPPPPPVGPAAGSVLAVVAVVVALLLELMLRPYIQPVPFVLFFVAVFAAAWLGGFPGGLLATALAAALGNFFFLSTAGFDTDSSALVATGLFAAVATLVTFVTASLHAGYRERERLHAQALAARDVFLSVASHELRTPITVAQLQVQRLRRSLRQGRFDETRVVGQVESTAASIERLAALVDALLDVSRVTSGNLVVERRPVDLSAVVTNAAGRLKEAARQRGSELRLDVQPGLRGAGDPLRLEQVVTNLVENALKYGAGEPILVRLARTDGHATLSVVDRGVGIAPGDLARIFDRFERASDSRQYGGLGLGLWISREIVQASGGTIAVESAPGEGATFTVELPISLGA